MTPTAAVREALGPAYRMKSDREIAHIVVSVLGAFREPSEGMLQAFHDVEPCERVLPGEGFPAMIDALIEEVTTDTR